MSGTNELCLQVDDALAEVLDGTAPAPLFDHIAECARGIAGTRGGVIEERRGRGGRRGLPRARRRLED